MPHSLNEFLVALTYPPVMSLVLLLAGAIGAILRWRKLAIALSVLGIAWSLLWSIPWCSELLRATLARNHPVVAETNLPRADAIVVLGGGRYDGWLRRDRVDPDDLKHSRLAAGARAWLAGRAPVIILSGGSSGGGGRSEAETMALAIAKTGIPASAVLLEERSVSTQGNAEMIAALARERGMRQVLLVTSSVHMPRAALLFRDTGIDVVPVPVPEDWVGREWGGRWLPSPLALWRSGRALKEYAALLAIHLQMTWRGNRDAHPSTPET